MNLFHEAKKVLDKDGKVNPLGPHGKSKLTGREISAYFRRNPVKDATIRKAVTVALDLEGAMTTAAQEIKKFYGDKVLKSKEVQFALKYANEGVIHEYDDISEGSFYGRDDLVKQFATPKKDRHLFIKLRKTDSHGTHGVSMRRKGNEDKIKKYKADGYKEVPVESVEEGKGSDIFKKYGSIINRLSDKEKDEVIELLYTMNTQSGRRYKEAFGKVKELLNMDYTPEGANLQEASALNMIDKAFNTKGDKEFQYGVAKLLNMTGIQVAKGMQKQNPKGFELMVKALADNTKVKLQTDKNIVKMMRQAGIKEEIIQEVTQQEVNAVKKLSKDAEKMKKDYFKIAKMGDKELADGKYNSYYESILKMQQKVLSLIGALNNKMRMESTNLMDTYRLIGEQKVEFLEEEKKLKFTNIKDKTLEKHLKVVTKKVGAKLEKISGGFAVSDTDMRGFTAVVDYIFDKSIKKNMLDGGGMSDVTMHNEDVDPKKERLKRKREQIKQKIERERAAAQKLSDKIKIAQKNGDERAEYNYSSQRMNHYYEISHLKDKLDDMKESSESNRQIWEDAIEENMERSIMKKMRRGKVAKGMPR